MNEAETRAELIDSALAKAGWGKVDGSLVRREFITVDQTIVMIEIIDGGLACK